MSQIPPVDLEFAVVESVYHLMGYRVFHMFLRVHSILAQHYTVVRMKSTRFGLVTRMALDVIGCEGTPGHVEVLEHENYDGT